MVHGHGPGSEALGQVCVPAGPSRDGDKGDARVDSALGAAPSRGPLGPVGRASCVVAVDKDAFSLSLRLS